MGCGPSSNTPSPVFFTSQSNSLSPGPGSRSGSGTGEEDPELNPNAMIGRTGSGVLLSVNQYLERYELVQYVTCH